MSMNDAGLRHPAHGRLVFPYSKFLPKPVTARGVQIDIKGDKLGLR